MIKKIKLEDWRQFKSIDIEFDQRITVLTGANGTGKTTILNILGELVGKTTQFVSNVKRLDNGMLAYSCGVNKDREGNTITIGEIGYGDKEYKILAYEQRDAATYGIHLEKEVHLKGMYISSHRSKFAYKPITTIPTKALTRDEIYAKYREYSNKKDSFEYYDPRNEAPTKYIKEALIALATFGYGNNVVTPNQKSIELFEGFEDILRKILPPKLEFKKLVIEVPEVLLETNTGSFAVDAVSGGIASIIELAWQIYMFAESNEEYIVLIDEPENHLHPELQQSLIPNLLDAFPNVQFIVASHNPFIITSCENATIYALGYNENRKVYSSKLDNINRAGSSNEILRDVLGITTTIPLWADQKIDKLIKQVYATGVTNESIGKFRKEMNTLGFSNIIPETLAKIFEGEKND